MLCALLEKPKNSKPYPCKELVSPLILLKGFGTEPITEGSIGMIHNGLESRRLGLIARIRTRSKTSFLSTIVRIITPALTVAVARGMLKKATLNISKFHTS